MTGKEIKVEEGEAGSLLNAVSAAGSKLPVSKPVNKGQSSGGAFNEFGDRLEKLERMVKEYQGRLDKDVKAAHGVVRGLQDADQDAARLIGGGR